MFGFPDLSLSDSPRSGRFRSDLVAFLGDLLQRGKLMQTLHEYEEAVVQVSRCLLRARQRTSSALSRDLLCNRITVHIDPPVFPGGASRPPGHPGGFPWRPMVPHGRKGAPT